MKKLKIDRAVIVEGKYDKIKLSNIISGLVITTNGFSVFKDKAMVEMIRKAAKSRGLLILTDSDNAGQQIRSYIKTIVGTDNIVNAYIPQIKGKEKRKPIPSAEGYLGVEGVDEEIIRNALLPFANEIAVDGHSIKKSDLYFAGLSGTDGCSKDRQNFEAFLGLPQNLPTNFLLDYLNFAYSFEEFKEVLLKWRDQRDKS